MTRLPRLRSSCWKTRRRATCCHCRENSGCRNEMMKKIHNRSDTDTCIVTPLSLLLERPRAAGAPLCPGLPRNARLRHRAHREDLVELGFGKEPPVQDDLPDRPPRPHELLDHLRGGAVAEVRVERGRQCGAVLHPVAALRLVGL